MSFVIVKPEPAAGLDVEAMAHSAQAAARETEIRLRVEQQLARLRADAEAEGRAKGQDEGYKAARAAHDAALSAAVAALHEAVRQLEAPLAGREQELADLTIELAFILARHVVGIEITTEPDSLRALVGRLLQDAAVECGPRQSISVRLNPDDHRILEPVAYIDKASLLADAAIDRGGAIVEIVAPEGDPIDKIEWDGTLEARFDTMRDALALTGRSDGQGRL